MNMQQPDNDLVSTNALLVREQASSSLASAQSFTSAHPESENPQPASDSSSGRPYSVYTRSEKWIIVSITGIAALFSPLTANIYLPAITTISTTFGESVELVNLSVTVYMVFQGISPMLWGSIADRKGRRPIFLACLLLLMLTCIGLALTPTSTFWLLMILRCLQAAGSASTVALGAGVIGDIATPAERGGFYGLFSIGPMVGPCIGPVLGGVLTDKLGWRSIFWFLTISSAICFLFMLLFLPETLRSIVGDGSIQAPLWDRPLLPIIGRKRQGANSDSRPPPKKVPNTLLLFTQPDVLLLLIYNATIYSVFYAISTTITPLFQSGYPFLSETDIGLCFLALGGGLVIGSCINGRMLDKQYRSMKKRLESRLTQDSEKGTPVTMREEDFPIEMARLKTMPAVLFVFVCCCVAYGWCLQKKVNIAVPLILQIILGYTIICVLNTTQTLIIDLFPKQGASITAVNNLVRCSFGAALVSVINLIVNALGAGWTFVLLSGVCVLITPLMFLVIRLGPSFREKRRKREVQEQHIAL